MEWLGSGGARDLELCAAVREVIDELAAHAEVLVSMPFPVSEWRPGDGSDDDRWRALTEIERRSVVSMLAAYDNLITWSEQTVGGPLEVIAWPDAACTADGQPRKLPEVWQKLRESTEYLNAERMRVARFRQEMAFLEKRRVAGHVNETFAAATKDEPVMRAAAADSTVPFVGNDQENRPRDQELQRQRPPLDEVDRIEQKGRDEQHGNRAPLVVVDEHGRRPDRDRVQDAEEHDLDHEPDRAGERRDQSGRQGARPRTRALATRLLTSNGVRAQRSPPP